MKKMFIILFLLLVVIGIYGCGERTADNTQNMQNSADFADASDDAVAPSPSDNVDSGMDSSAQTVDTEENTAIASEYSEKKAEQVSDKEQVSADIEQKSADEFDGANYEGSFPAPEGMVLEGWYGQDKYEEPAGDGTYRFRMKTESRQHLTCKDSTRTLVGSKGLSWENGFYDGYNTGNNHANTFPKTAYDETPPSVPSSNDEKYYDEGYKLGYDRGYAGGALFTITYGCGETKHDTSMFDEDGWVKYSNIENMPNLKAIYAPPSGFAGMIYSANNAFGTYTKSFRFEMFSDEAKVENAELNKGKPALNMDRIDFLDGELEGAEKSMTAEQFAQAVYDVMKQHVDTNYKGTCVLTEPTLESKSYPAGNTFAQLTFTQICTGYSSASENVWNFHAYAFMKSSDGNRMLSLSFHTPHSVKADGMDDYDISRLPSADFVAQFLDKIEY
ncbi:MAG: hypothetical protein ABIG89_02025 [Candidatus Woesearchaeota archaeon]